MKIFHCRDLFLSERPRAADWRGLYRDGEAGGHRESSGEAQADPGKKVRICCVFMQWLNDPYCAMSLGHLYHFPLIFPSLGMSRSSSPVRASWRRSREDPSVTAARALDEEEEDEVEASEEVEEEEVEEQVELEASAGPGSPSASSV